MLCAPVTHLDEDALSFAASQVKAFTHPVKEKQKCQSQTDRKVKLVLTRPLPGVLINPQWHLPTARRSGDGSREGLPVGCSEAGLPWLQQGWIAPDVSPAVGRQSGQTVRHLGQWDHLGMLKYSE